MSPKRTHYGPANNSAIPKCVRANVTAGDRLCPVTLRILSHSGHSVYYIMHSHVRLVHIEYMTHVLLIILTYTVTHAHNTHTHDEAGTIHRVEYSSYCTYWWYYVSCALLCDPPPLSTSPSHRANLRTHLSKTYFCILRRTPYVIRCAMCNRECAAAANCANTSHCSSSIYNPRYNSRHV